MKELGFEDLVKGLLLLYEKGLITRQLVFNIVTQVVANSYHIGMSSDFIERFMIPKGEK